MSTFRNLYPDGIEVLRPIVTRRRSFQLVWSTDLIDFGRILPVAADLEERASDEGEVADWIWCRVSSTPRACWAVKAKIRSYTVVAAGKEVESLSISSTQLPLPVLVWLMHTLTLDRVRADPG